MLALKGFEIGALTLRPVRRDPNALLRDARRSGNRRRFRVSPRDRDKRAGALARHDETVGAQGGDRLAHDRAADAHRGDHFLLRRQFRAGRQLGAGDVRGDPLGDFAAQNSRRRDWL